MNNKKLICVNLSAPPGSGKSTLAAIVFAKLKMKEVNCELVTEFAKDKTWENNTTALANQLYIFAKQYYRMSRCADKVDVIITDSPLYMSPLYCKDDSLLKPLIDITKSIMNKYVNLNYFLKRVKKYNPVGRNQTEAESDAMIPVLKKIIEDQNIEYTEINGELESSDKIVADVMLRLDEMNAAANL